MKTAPAHPRLRAAVAALSVFVAGCGSNPPRAHAPPVSARPVEPPGDSTVLVPATARRGDPCNVRSDGEVRVGAQIVERGAALVFTTSGDVRSFRERVTQLIVSAPQRTGQPRSDNIRGGVRLVFEAETAGDRAVVQRVVREHARELAKTCGMVLAAPGEWTAEEPREESSPAAAGPPVSSPAREDTPADQQKESAADSDSAKPPGKADPKPEEPAKPPKPEAEPKDSDKPKDDKIPKDDEKPPIPRLPDPRPDPIAPE